MSKISLSLFMRKRVHALRRGLLGRFVKRQDGATAVEFGLVAAPFLAMTFAIIETAMVFFAGQVLETAATDSARLIMTGQAQAAGYNQAQFKTQVCNKIYGVFNCNTGMYVDVRTYSSFGSISNAKPIDANGNMTNNFVYQPGQAGDIVVVKLLYQFPVYVSLLGLDLSDMSGGKRLIVATSVFRNEPFSN